jgi:peptidyl-prolyl cis-trans isomerase SurA
MNATCHAAAKAPTVTPSGRSRHLPRPGRAPRPARAVRPATARILAAALLLVLVRALGPFPGLAPALAAAMLNRVVLRVNDQIATLYDYELRRAEFTKEILRREQNPELRKEELKQVGEAAFRAMFEELLLDSRAEQLAITVGDKELDAGVAQMRQNFGIKSDEEYAAALAQNGLTDEQLRAQMRRTMRMREVMSKEIQSRVKIKEEDLRRYYRKNIEQFRLPEQVQLREVVVLEAATPAAEERSSLAAAIRKEVAAGKPLADAVAQDAAKGRTGKVTELGWVSPGDLDKSLEAAVWKLPVNSVSEPVAGRGGLHLLQVIDRRPSRIQAFNEVSAAIQTKEQDRVFTEETAKYLVELEQKSLVVADPPAEAAGFRRNLGTKTGEESIPGLPAAAPRPPATPGAAVAPGEVKPQLPDDAKHLPASPTGEGGIQKPGTLPPPKPTSPSPIPPPSRQ